MNPQNYNYATNPWYGNPAYNQTQQTRQANVNLYGNPYPYNQQQQVVEQPQQQQTVQPSFLPGRVIHSEKDIFADEIPGNGSFATFIEEDLSKIYLKSWGGDGLVKSRIYELVNPENASNKSEGPNPFDEIMKRLDAIEEMVKRNNNSYKPRYKQNNNLHAKGAKKEEVEHA